MASLLGAAMGLCRLLLLPPFQQTQFLRARVEQLRKEMECPSSPILPPAPKESLAWKQPTCTFGVKPTFQQLKRFLRENSALLFSLLPCAPRLSCLSKLQRASLWCWSWCWEPAHISAVPVGV